MYIYIYIIYGLPQWELEQLVLGEGGCSNDRARPFLDNPYVSPFPSLCSVVFSLVWSTHPKKSIDFVGISCYYQNPGTKKVFKCSTPILGFPFAFPLKKIWRGVNSAYTTEICNLQLTVCRTMGYMGSSIRRRKI